MAININLKLLKYIIRDQFSTFFVVLSFFVIFLVTAYSIQKHLLLKEEFNRAKNETSIYKNRVDILRYNKSLTENKIDEYNNLLIGLIPDTENFFSIIYALETISIKSNFIISSYALNLTLSDKEKISIQIEGQGDSTAFISFLENYNFVGGRLITSEKIEFAEGKFSKSRISLNFYNKRVMQNTVVVPQLTQKDITLLNSIQNKISVILKPEDLSLSEDYETKTDPF